MAVISCPNCQGKLRFPDDSPPRKVKCPSCQQTFVAGPMGPIGSEGSVAIARPKAAPPKPAPEIPDDFDIVDDAEPSPSQRRENDDERPRSKRRVDDGDADRPRSRQRDEDDDDNRDRKKRRRDEDDDRPRSRRRDEDDDDEDVRDRKKRRRDEDDYDDDRPRSRRRGRDDYDDEDDSRDKAKVGAAQFRYARQGVGLAGIGLWCQVGSLAIVLFVQFLALVARESVEELYIPAGLAGLANWVLGCVGFSFLIAGAKKGSLFGLSIALVCVTALHLATVVYLTFQKDTVGFMMRESGSIHWGSLPTQLDTFVVMLLFGFFTTPVLIAAVLEIARFILFCLVLKEYGRICKDRDVSKAATMQLILMPVVLGTTLILFLILKMVAKTAGAGSGAGYIAFFMMLLQYGGYIAVYCMTAILCSKANDAIAYRKSK